MKFSSIKTDNDGCHLRQWDAAKFFERIRTDVNNHLIQRLRLETMPERVRHYRRYDDIPQALAAVELRRQTNDASGSLPAHQSYGSALPHQFFGQHGARG